MKKTLIALALTLGSATAALAADIVETAVKAGSFKTLVAAVQAAGLVDTLKGPGPFTVFAPTDEAFAKVPKEALEALLKDKAALTKVLTYHVVSGKVMAADVKAAKVRTEAGIDGREKQDALRHSFGTYTLATENDLDALKADLEDS